jgi:hypothetical protein
MGERERGTVEPDGDPHKERLAVGRDGDDPATVGDESIGGGTDRR